MLAETREEHSSLAEMNSNTSDRIVKLLIPFMQTVKERQAILNANLTNHPLLHRGTIEWEGSPQVFTANLVQKLEEYGSWNDELSLITLLSSLHSQVGQERGKEIKDLIDELRSMRKVERPLEELNRRTQEVLRSGFVWCSVPEGSVTAEDTNVKVAQFFIAKYPITNAEFRVFERAGDGYIIPTWWDYSEDAQEWRRTEPISSSTSEDDHHPRTNVTWFEAVAFCRWLSFQLEREIRLPKEAEWQRAAQGDDNRRYPWGNVFERNRCNTAGLGFLRTTSVTRFDLLPTDPRSGLSPHGVADTIGNVEEWCLDNYQTRDISIGIRAEYRTLRGGSYYSAFADVNSRRDEAPHDRYDYIGFRICATNVVP
jgi:hypothetical protein